MKGRNYNWSSILLMQIPINLGVAQAQTALTLSFSWEGEQAMQMLNPSWSVLTPHLECVQAMQMLIPRQAVQVPPQLGRCAGRAESQSQQRYLWHYSWGTCFFLDNTAGVTEEQGQRPRRQAPQLPPYLGPQHTQPRSSRGFTPGRGKQPE